MSVGVLTDEHVPGAVISVLRAMGYDVKRAKDAHSEGTADGVLLEFAAETGRVVVTGDFQFTVVDGTHVETHAGVIYGDQAKMKRRPEDVGAAIDQICSTMPPETLRGAEWYLNDWL